MKKLLISLLMGSSVAASVAQTGLDLTYGNAGKAVLPPAHLQGLKSQWGTIEVLPDGGALLAGFVQKSADETDGIIMKILPNGQPDLNFDSDGMLVIDNYPKEYIRDIVLTRYGTVLLVGNYVTPTTDKAFVMEVGLRDSYIGSPGIIQRQVTGYGVTPTGIIHSDDKVLIGGYAFNPSSNTRDFIVIKLFGTTPDPQFGKNGSVFVDIFKDDRCFQILERPNGKIILVGYSNDNNNSDVYSIVQLNANGSLDTQFGNGGKLGLRISASSMADRAYKAALQADGKLVVVGTSRISNQEVVSSIRLNSNGSYDNTYDGDGKTFLFLGPSDKAYDVKLSSDGKIWIAGATRQYDNTYRKVLFRLLPNGARDLTFANQGLRVLPSNILTDYYGSTYTVGMALQQDGSVLTVASQTDNAYLLNRWLSTPVNPAAFSFNTIPYFTHSPSYSTITTNFECGDAIYFYPTQTAGSHFWDFGDGSPIALQPAPGHAYQTSGTFTVTHTVTNDGFQSYSQAIAQVVVKPFPVIDLSADLPDFATKSVGLFEENYYYSDGENKVRYKWESPQATIGYGSDTSVYIQYQYPSAGIYSVKLTLFDKYKGSSCKSSVETKLYIVDRYYFDCDQIGGEELGSNLVVNGTFDNATCPSNTFGTDFSWKCAPDGYYEPNKVSIVSNASQFATYFKNTSSTLPGISGNFLLASSFFNPYKTTKEFESKVLWSQQIPVQAGKKYRFKADVASLDELLRGEYTFSHTILVIDNVPVMQAVHNNMCFEYSATQNKTIQLSIVKTDGFRFYTSSIGVDNIIFAPILQSAPNTREDIDAYATVIERELTVSPNPASDVLNVSYLRPFIDFGHLEILEGNSGKIVKSMPMTSSTMSLSLDNMASGMYFLKLYGSDGSVLGTKKFLTVK